MLAKKVYIYKVAMLTVNHTGTPSAESLNIE
jgi:hypothetical protein